MTDRELEKLKAICENEGFDITCESMDQEMFTITKKPDPARVSVRGYSWDRTIYPSNDYSLDIDFTIKNSNIDDNKAIELKNHLAQCLESYLNNPPT